MGLVVALIFWIIVVPLLVVVGAILGQSYRDRKNMLPLPPRVIGQVVTLCILFAWLMACCTLVSTLAGWWPR